MARIFLNRGGQRLGEFTPQEVADGLRSGRFLPGDLAWREPMEVWQPLSAFADLPPAGEPAGPGATMETPPELPPRGYEPGRLSIRKALRVAWTAFSRQWPHCVLAMLIFFGISMVVQTPMQVGQWVFEFLPWKDLDPTMTILLGGGAAVIFLFFWAVSSLVSIFLTGGLMLFSVDVVRHPFRSPRLAVLFTGFRSPHWSRLLMFSLLWMLVFLGVAVGAAIPGVAVYFAFDLMPAVITGMVIFLIAGFYLMVAFNFGYLLVIDRGLGAWPALRTALVTVHSQWFRAFALLILMGLIALLGVLLCCVGLLATMPFGYLLWAEGYRQIFGDPEEVK